MPYTSFHDRFPETAERETRTFASLAEPGLPPDTYALVELYCNEAG